MEIKPIRNEADYDAALEAIDGLMGAAPDTPEGDKLEVLVTLVEAYEAERWSLEPPDPVSVIEHVMEARGLRQRDLATLIGSQPRASEVLNRRRPLTLPSRETSRFPRAGAPLVLVLVSTADRPALPDRPYRRRRTARAPSPSPRRYRQSRRRRMRFGSRSLSMASPVSSWRASAKSARRSRRPSENSARA